jgi:chromosome segregation ATPase
MALASINFQKATGHAFRHNDRSDKVTYLVDRSDENEVSRSATDARAMADRLYAQAIEKLTAAKVKRKPMAENSRWEAVVNLNAGHGLDDVQQLAQAIEKETGFTCLQIAVHKDEGKSAKEKNYHAHIVFHTLDRDTGRQLYRREHMTPEKLTRLQDLAATSLDMERGQRGSKRKRLDHKEYKAAAQEREALENENEGLRYRVAQLEAELVSVKEVNEQYRGERERLKASGEATQADYQALKRDYDALKEQAKAERITRRDLALRLADKAGTLIGQNRTPVGQLPPERFDHLVEKLEATAVDHAVALIEKQAGELDQAFEYAQQLNRENEQLQAQQIAPDYVAQLRQDVKKAERDAEAAREREKAVTAKYEALKAELREAKAEIERLRGELRERGVMRERQRLRKELGVWERYRDQLVEDMLRRERARLGRSLHAPRVSDEELRTAIEGMADKAIEVQQRDMLATAGRSLRRFVAREIDEIEAQQRQSYDDDQDNDYGYTPLAP